jgi:hypothetical protein
MASDLELERIYQRIADRAMAAAPKPCTHGTRRGDWCPACAHEQRIVDDEPSRGLGRPISKRCVHVKSVHSKFDGCIPCRRAYHREYYHAKLSPAAKAMN